MLLSTQEWTLVLNIASVASSLAVVITLIVLIWQTRILQAQSQSAIDASRAQNHAVLREEMFKINEVFLEYPEIRKHFYNGVPIDTSDASYARAEAGAEMFLDIMEHMLLQASIFPRLYHLSPEEVALWGSWDTYIVDIFVSSPLMRTYLQEKREWYTPHLIELLEQAQYKISHTNISGD